MAASTYDRRKQWESIADRAEREFRENPAGYRRRLLLLGLLGYAVILGALVALVALLAGGVAAAMASTGALILLIKSKLIFVFGLAVWVLARSLAVRIDEPEGLVLNRERAPALFEEIADLTRRIRTPPIHRVVITPAFNASITQVPRFGVLGPHRNTLELGLPLLLAIAPDAARAILAHELGHLSRQHSAFAAWTYRARASWTRIAEAFDAQDGWALLPLRRFLRWYAPRYSAYSFALARANEYEADALAAMLTTPETAARALTATALRDVQADAEFWRPLRAEVEHDPEPEDALFTRMRAFHRHYPGSPEDAQRLARLLAVRTDRADTHPALAERLAALGQPPQTQGTLPLSAAEAWLGSALDGVLEAFDRDWLAHHADLWRAQFEESQNARAALALLETLSDDDLAPEDRWQRASLTERLRGAQAALPLYESLLDAHPEVPEAHFHVARIRLAQGEAAALELLAPCFAVRHLALPAAEIALDFVRAHGTPEQIEVWRTRLDHLSDREAAAEAERSVLGPKDTLLPAELTPEQLEALRAELAAHRRLRAVWIARKAVVHYPDTALYVLGYQARWLTDTTALTAHIAGTLVGPGNTLIIPWWAIPKRARRTLRTGHTRVL